MQNLGSLSPFFLQQAPANGVVPMLQLQQRAIYYAPAVLGDGSALPASAEIAGRRAGSMWLLDRQAVTDLAEITSSLLRGG
jgi:hypothetical protein